MGHIVAVWAGLAGCLGALCIIGLFMFNGLARLQARLEFLEANVDTCD